MEQHEFIWLANNMQIETVRQDEIGHTEVELRPHIKITHDYNSHNLMLLSFTETRDFYKIPSKDALEDIFRLHLTNENLEMPLHEYADANLTRLN